MAAITSTDRGGATSDDPLQMECLPHSAERAEAIRDIPRPVGGAYQGVPFTTRAAPG
ncbi:hypothetical protein GCM10022206_65150 [Streptomyces chiangmaiensis]